MKSFSKRVASFAMAAAMVLSVAAVAPVDAEAATAKITKKSSITAGKTYTYNVKNVTKSQYIKVRMSSGVTVKYNNKTVKKDSTKIKGGKTIALKVKAADKVGNYKATLKAVIYNKKNNKKVKTLTTQSTVKCTTLKVTSVQTASTNGKYLVATFNKAVDSLNPADITIRNLNTNELLGVEDVKLASNGKSATIVLAGSEYSNATNYTENDFVAPNVDYSFTVTKNGATASTNFTVDAIAAYVTVVNYNPELREITYTIPRDKNTNVSLSADNTVKVPDTVSNADFQDLLGTTVNVWYNKNNVARKIERVNETVIEGAFEYVNEGTAVPYFKDKATGKTYPISNVIGDEYNNNSDIHGTIEILGVNGSFYYGNVKYDSRIPGKISYDEVTFDTSAATNKTDYDYAKLVLYSNGKIRAIVTEPKFEEKCYVTKVDAEKNLVYSGSKAYNLKGYTIVDNNKVSSVKNIKEGDVVFVSTGNNKLSDGNNLKSTYAEIYTTSKEGKIEASYDKEFKLDGALYSHTGVGTVTKDAKGEYKTVGTMGLAAGKAFIAAGGAVTVFSDRAGKPVFLKGEQKAAATGSWVSVLVTADMKYYEHGLNKYIQIKGFDGSSVKAFDINEDDLRKVTRYGKPATVVTAVQTDEKSLTDKFSFVKDATPGAVSGNILFNGAHSVDYDILTGSINGTNTMIDLYKEADGRITEIKINYAFQPADDFVGAKSFVKEDDGQNYQITAGTPVYSYDGANFVKVDYSKYSAVTPANKTLVYAKPTTNGLYSVEYVVVNNAALVPVHYVDCVVGSIQTEGNKVVYLDVFQTSDSEVKHYDVFRDDVVKSYLGNVEPGWYVRLGLADDNKTVVDAKLKANVVTGTPIHIEDSYQNVDTGAKTFKATNGNTYTLATEKYTIVKRSKNPQGTTRYETSSLAELATVPVDADVYVHYHQTGAGTTGFVDAVVIDYVK